MFFRRPTQGRRTGPWSAGRLIERHRAENGVTGPGGAKLTAHEVNFADGPRHWAGTAQSTCIRPRTGIDAAAGAHSGQGEVRLKSPLFAVVSEPGNRLGNVGLQAQQLVDLVPQSDP